MATGTPLAVGGRSIPDGSRHIRAASGHFGGGIDGILAAVRAAREVEHLLALPEGDLARRGLARDEIVRHVVER